MNHRSRVAHRRTTLVVLLVLSCVVPFTGSVPLVEAAGGDIVIAEIYAGGGGANADFAADYVQLINRGDHGVTIDGWSVQVAPAETERWRVTELSGSLPPGGTYLVAGKAAERGESLPPPDAQGTISISANGGKVALVAATEALECGVERACATSSGVVDFVGYGRYASAYEGSGPAKAPGSTRSIRRLLGGCIDSDDNAADLDVAIAEPRTTADPATPCLPVAPPPVSGSEVAIHDIQGLAHRSPFEGQHVSVTGVVTALRRSNAGFFLQDLYPDGNDGTSEAIRVSALDSGVAVGDAVEVTGTVREVRGTSDEGDGLSITVLAADDDGVVIQGFDRELPEPVVIGVGGRVPPSEAMTDDAPGSDIEAGGSFDSAADGLDFYESLEGMLVAIDDPVVIAPRLGHTEVAVVGDSGETATGLSARGALVAERTVDRDDRNPERLYLDTDLLGGRGLSPTVKVGDRFPGRHVGVLDYNYGLYVVQLLERPEEPIDGGLQPEVASPAGEDELSVATFNLKNLAADDPGLDDAEDADRFARLGTIIATNLAAPDIVVLEEVQDNTGTAPNPDGTADASQTAARLIAAIGDAGGPDYQYADVAPVNGQDGGQPGSNIRVGFLWRTDHGLSLVDRGGGGSAATAVTVSVTSDGPALSTNPARIDPGNEAFRGSRKPIVGEFSFRGQTVFVIGCHFTSKLGSEAPFGRFQPPKDSGARTRTQQAEVVAGFVAQIRAINPAARVLVAGDFNDLTTSTAVRALEDGGLTSLVGTLPAEEQYSISFAGEGQGIDQLVVSPALVDLLVPGSVDIVHVNSEFPDSASDHDPVVARFRLG